MFNVLSHIYSSFSVNLGLRLQSRFHHQVLYSCSSWSMCYQNVSFSLLIQKTCGAQAHMMLTTISSNPSSILITGSQFLLTPIRSSFSSLDSRGAYYPHNIPLLLVCTTTEQLAASPTNSLCRPYLLHTQHSNLSRFHHIRPAPFLFQSPSQHSNCPLS